MASDTRKDSAAGSSASVETKQTSSQDDDTNEGIKFKDWGFQVEKLFQVAYRFYKRNESKAFHLSFDERSQMNALVLQAKFGNYDSKKAPDIGTLDFVGKNRHYHWSLLAGMSKTEAMSNFICNLDRLCPLFKAHAEAVKISSENAILRASPSQKYDSLSSQNSSMTSSFINQSFDDPKSFSELNEQLKAIRTSLCKQTYEQFKGYAKKEHPNDIEQQKSLIAALQEQYYHQYISQMHPELNTTTISNQSSDVVRDNSDTGGNIEPKATDRATTSSSTSNNDSGQVSHIDDRPIEATKDEFVDIVIGPATSQQRISSNENVYPYPRNSPSQVSPRIAEDNSNHNYIEPQQATISSVASQETNNQQRNYTQQQQQQQFQDYSQPSPSQFVAESGDLTQQQQQQQQPSSSNPSTQAGEVPSRHVVDTWDCGSSASSSSSTSSGFGSPLKQTIAYEPLEPATSWTKRGICEFKESLINDKQGGSYTISQGVVLIIEVPTYPEGRYIHWEFATDDYDIGFGVDFVFETRRPLDQPLAMNIYERDDDDDDDGEDDEDVPEDIEAMASRLDQEQANYDVELAGQASLFKAENDDGPASMLARRSDLIRRRAQRIERENNTISILPTYRRDSHEEVHAGRHKYPGQGYYMLKFDNTYSMLRSKSLYYRICYFI